MCPIIEFLKQAIDNEVVYDNIVTPFKSLGKLSSNNKENL